MTPRTRISDPTDRAQLAGFAARKRERSRLEIEDLLEALDWALRHPAVGPEPYAAAEAARTTLNQGWVAEPEAKRAVWADAANAMFDDPWTPAVDWSAFGPMAAAMGRSTAAGKALVNDALVLAVRLPLLFEAVRLGRVEVWRARRIAQAVRMRPVDVAAEVDAKVTPVADSIGVARLEAIIDEAMLRLHVEERELEIMEARESYGVELVDSFHGFHGGKVAPVAELRIRGDILDLTAFHSTASKIARILGEQQHQQGLLPESLEVRKARAIGILADPALALELLNGGSLGTTKHTSGMQLVVHLNRDEASISPVARIEGSLRARLAEQIAEWCHRPESSFVVLPVVDLTEHTESASESVMTEKMATRARLRTPTCVFPFRDRPSRRCDIDHRIPVGEGLGQHGASCDCNLVPLCRHHHRLKTHAGWRYTPVEPGVWLWSDPHGRSYLRHQHSTRDVTHDPPSSSPGSGSRENHIERRDQLRRARIPAIATAARGLPVRSGCTQVHDPPPF